MSEPEAPKESLQSRTREMLREFDIRAKKRLGQHFLVNTGILQNILKAAELSSSDIVLEIGPGLGVLTRELGKRAGWVIAVELDKELAETLRKTSTGSGNISVINRNILEVEPADLIRQESVNFPDHITEQQAYKLVANLPYYITAPIIRHFCETGLKPHMMVIMVQKEVAKNIVAKPGEMSILAVSIQFYGKPRIVSYVPAGNFFPVPRVDSAILKINMYPSPPVNVTGEASFFKIVRAGFCAARKQIVNSLSQGLEIPKSQVIHLLDKSGIAPQRRAETMSLEEWAILERTYSEEIN